MRFLFHAPALLMLLATGWLVSEIHCRAAMAEAGEDQAALCAPHKRHNGGKSSRASGGHPFLVAQLLRQVGEDEYRISQFLGAARQGDVGRLRNFLDQGLDVNAKNSNGDTALMEAAGNGRKEVVELLLARGADVQTKNKSRQDVVSSAVMNRQREIALMLLDTGKVKPSELLSAALRHADVELSRTLIARGPTPIQSSFLVPACESGNIEIVRLVLDKGADPNFSKGYPLMKAVEYAPLDVIQLLLEKGARAEPDQQADNRHTPLSVACFKRRPDAAKLLLEKGANINVKADKQGHTPLIYAVEASKTEPGYELVKLLLKNRADVKTKDADGKTALHHTCNDGRIEVVTLLLDNGADIEARDNNGVTPLIEAAFAGRVQVARLLIDRRANVNARSEKGWTPLAAAKKKGSPELERLLRSRGAKQ